MPIVTTDKKKAIFDHYRKSLAAAGLATSNDDCLICPLCWQETPFDALSHEHIIPGSVGGTRQILTCLRCNSEHGSSLDSHLSQYQTIADGFQGHGTLRTKLIVNGKVVVSNLKWGDGTKNFVVVGKASNRTASDRILEDFRAGNVSDIKFTLRFGYAKNNFQTAVLRAAYLVLFKCFGYEYAKYEIVQIIRRRICNRSLEHPQLRTLILELRNFQPPYDHQHFVVPGDVNGVQFFLVIIRVRKVTTTYLGACLPVPTDRCDEFFELMDKCSCNHNGLTLTIPTQSIFT